MKLYFDTIYFYDVDKACPKIDTAVNTTGRLNKLIHITNNQMMVLLVENIVRRFGGYFRGGAQGFRQGGIRGCVGEAAQGFYGGYQGK